MLKTTLLIAALAAFPLYAQTPDAKASFAKTLAAGARKWNFKDAQLTISRQGVPTVNKCSTAGAPVSLKGEFPAVNFSLGEMNCDVDAREVTMIKSITFAFVFKAYHIPATTAPNQFRLQYAGKIPTYPRVEASSVQALNALALENSVYMDLIATEQDRLWKMDSVYYFAEVAVDRGSAGQPDKLRINLTINDAQKGAKTELTLIADLIPN